MNWDVTPTFHYFSLELHPQGLIPVSISIIFRFKLFVRSHWSFSRPCDWRRLDTAQHAANSHG